MGIKPSRFLLAGGLAFLGIAFLLASSVLSSGEKYATVTSLGDGPLGVSSFVSIYERISHQEAVVRKTAILDASELHSDDMFFALAPRMPFSTREKDLFKDFRKKGGVAVLSFHDGESFKHVNALLDTVSDLIEIVDDPSYVDRQSKKVRARQSSFPFATGRNYAFYARMKLKGCSDSADVECYAQSIDLKPGKIVLFSGVPPIANVLIGREENSELAIELIREGRRMVFDEYHHFFTERTVTDLLLEPSFAFPIFGLILAAILFLAFGRLNLTDAFAERKTDRTPLSYHALNTRIISGLVSYDTSNRSVAKEQGRFLAQEFPAKVSEIEEIVHGELSPSEQGRLLLALHKKFLEERV
jgi:hypothetical protein